MCLLETDKLIDGASGSQLAERNKKESYCFINKSISVSISDDSVQNIYFETKTLGCVYTKHERRG